MPSATSLPPRQTATKQVGAKCRPNARPLLRRHQRQHKPGAATRPTNPTRHTHACPTLWFLNALLVGGPPTRSSHTSPWAAQPRQDKLPCLHPQQQLAVPSTVPPEVPGRPASNTTGQVHHRAGKQPGAAEQTVALHRSSGRTQLSLPPSDALFCGRPAAARERGASQHPHAVGAPPAHRKRSSKRTS